MTELPALPASESARTPLSVFMGAAVAEQDGWRVYRGKSGWFASPDGYRGIPYTDPSVPASLRAALNAVRTTEDKKEARHVTRSH